MSITLNEAFWTNRLQAHEQRLQPSWYNRQSILQPALTALNFLSLAFFATSPALVLTFGASLVFPVLAVIVTALSLFVLSKNQEGNYRLHDPQWLIDREKRALADPNNIALKMIWLKNTSSTFTADELIPICYGTGIENFLLEQLKDFVTNEYLHVFNDDTRKSLKEALVRCDAGLKSKRLVSWALHFPEGDLMKLQEDRELKKGYQEFIKRNGDVYELLSSTGQERYKQLVRWQYNEGKANHELGMQWVRDLHRAGLTLYGNDLQNCRTMVQQKLQGLFNFCEQATDIKDKATFAELFVDSLTALEATGIMNQDWPFLETIRDHFAGNYDLYEKIFSHPFYLGLKTKGLLSQAQIKLAERGTKT